MKTLKIALVALMILGTAPVLAANWETSKPEAAVSKLPTGKGLRTHTSPDKKRFLVVRDEGGHGDFFYEHIYYFDGKRYTPLGSYMQRGIVTPVSWTQDGVSFEAWTPTGPDGADVLRIEYFPAKGQMRTKVIRHEAVQAAG